MGHLTIKVWLGWVVLAAGLAAGPGVAQQGEYARSTQGTRWLEGAGGLAIKVLVEATNLGGGEVEVAEITFPAGSVSGEHTHGSVEIFYVLSGELEHVVNGESHLLRPGMVGIVRIGDKVIHKVPSADVPARAVVIWAPGGEAARLAPFFRQRPVEAAADPRQP